MGRLLVRGRDSEQEPAVEAEEPVQTDAAPDIFADPREAPVAADPPRHVHAVPTNDDLKASRAVDLFNAGEHTRTVAGVARSLGSPGVTVRPSRDEPSVVSIVVGWELSWYRFEADLSDEAGGVRVVGKGYELSELSEDERAWNAAANDRGVLAFAG
jgi:hypothetical protein